MQLNAVLLKIETLFQFNDQAAVCKCSYYFGTHTFVVQLHHKMTIKYNQTTYDIRYKYVGYMHVFQLAYVILYFSIRELLYKRT